MTITKDGIPYTPFPFRANWDAARPQLTLTYDTAIEQALRGYEQRGQYRAHPRPRLSYSVDVDGFGAVMNTLRTIFRVDHATAHLPGANEGTGRVAVPMVGRESWLQSHTAGALTIDPTPWPWAVNDWLIVYDDATTSTVVAQVTAVAANVLTIGSLSAPLTSLMELGDGSMVAPLFFGRMEAPELDLQSSWHGDVDVTVTGDSYVIAPGVPPACVDEPEWPDVVGVVGPTAVATASVMVMTATFTGSASTRGTSPVDGVTLVALAGYDWDFGDGSTGVGAVAEHEYLAPGTYTAVLTVRDVLRRYDVATVAVVIVEPGGDGSSGEVGGGL